jgi:HEAT repeat protein
MVLQNLLSDMRLLPGSDLLVQTLAEMRGDCVRRVFILLGVRFPRADMAAIQRAVTEGAGEVRANALEVLDNTLKGELRERLIGGLLEPKPGLRPDMEDALERLRGLMDWPDEWLKACAIHTAGRGGIATVLPEVASAAESQEGLVRETALWAIGRIPATAGGGTADRV